MVFSVALFLFHPDSFSSCGRGCVCAQLKPLTEVGQQTDGGFSWRRITLDTAHNIYLNMSKSRGKRKGKRGRIHSFDSDSDDGAIYEETEPPMPSCLPKSTEFIANKELLYARIDYQIERSEYYLQQWREGKLNIEDLSMNTEHGTSFSKPK